MTGGGQQVPSEHGPGGRAGADRDAARAADAPVATRRRRSARRPTPSAAVPLDELRELAAPGSPRRPPRHRLQHRPGRSRRRSPARCPSTWPASRPRPRPTPVPARRSGPRSRATSTCTPTGPTAAPPSRRWRARRPSSATSTWRSPTTRRRSRSPTASTPSGCESSSRWWRELNEELAPFRILTGIEVDILEDGALDQDDDLLAELDVVVASVHSKLRMSEQPMTDRMVAAMANPHTDILGHCTGRMVLGQGPPGVDVRRRPRVRRVRALRQGGRDQLPARAARPADAAARAGRGHGLQGVDRHRRPRAGPARVAALRLRPRGRGRRAPSTASSTPGPSTSCWSGRRRHSS